jgi:hypothetical protein
MALVTIRPEWGLLARSTTKACNPPGTKSAPGWYGRPQRPASALSDDRRWRLRRRGFAFAYRKRFAGTSGQLCAAATSAEIGGPRFMDMVRQSLIYYTSAIGLGTGRAAEIAARPGPCR